MNNKQVSGKTAKKQAARRSTKSGQHVTRNNTADRKEIRRETIDRQGHPK